MPSTPDLAHCARFDGKIFMAFTNSTSLRLESDKYSHCAGGLWTPAELELSNFFVAWAPKN